MEELDKEEVKKIAYNCREATFLIEKKQLTTITLREQMELKIHLAGCSVCRIFEEQSIIINKMVKNLFHGNHKLDDEFKTSLKDQIKRKINKQ